MCESESVWRWESGGGSMWRWECVEMGVCGDGSMEMECVEVGVCGDGSVWRWECVEVGVCGGGSVWRWECVEMGVCGGGSVWKWECRGMERRVWLSRGRGGGGKDDKTPNQLTFSTNWILASIRKSLKTLFTLVSVPYG